MGHRYVKALTGKMAVTVAVLFTLGLAVYLLLIASTMTPANRDILGQSFLDARLLFVLAAVSGCLFATHFRDQLWLNLWLVLLTACSLGRGLDLLLVGDPLLPRSMEIRGAVTWVLHWGLGIVCALLLTAYSLLNPGDQDHPGRR